MLLCKLHLDDLQDVEVLHIYCQTLDIELATHFTMLGSHACPPGEHSLEVAMQSSGVLHGDTTHVDDVSFVVALAWGLESTAHLEYVDFLPVDYRSHLLRVEVNQRGICDGLGPLHDLALDLCVAQVVVSRWLADEDERLLGRRLSDTRFAF